MTSRHPKSVTAQGAGPTVAALLDYLSRCTDTHWHYIAEGRIGPPGPSSSAERRGLQKFNFNPKYGLD